MEYIYIGAILLILELLYFKVADRYNIIDKPNERSSHSTITLRGGGIIFLIGVCIYPLFFGFEYPWFMIGMLAISIVSFIDDIAGVSSRGRLVVQFAAILMLLQQLGILNTEPWWIIIAALIGCVGVINAYNFMDGINGMTAGYSLSVLLPLIYLNLHIDFIESSLLITTLISLLIFSLFNFRKRAVCFAGDVGAVGVAFILLFFIGRLILLTGDLNYILLLAIYGIDSLLTIVHRIMLRENIDEAHRKHIYQIMANELRIPHWAVSLLYLSLQILISFGLILSPVDNWIYTLSVLTALTIGYTLFKRRYYWMHVEYLRTRQ